MGQVLREYYSLESVGEKILQVVTRLDRELEMHWPEPSRPPRPPLPGPSCAWRDGHPGQNGTAKDPSKRACGGQHGAVGAASACWSSAVDRSIDRLAQRVLQEGGGADWAATSGRELTAVGMMMLRRCVAFAAASNHSASQEPPSVCQDAHFLLHKAAHLPAEPSTPDGLGMARYLCRLGMAETWLALLFSWPPLKSRQPEPSPGGSEQGAARSRETDASTRAPMDSDEAELHGTLDQRLAPALESFVESSRLAPEQVWTLEAAQLTLVRLAGR